MAIRIALRTVQFTAFTTALGLLIYLFPQLHTDVFAFQFSPYALLSFAAIVAGIILLFLIHHLKNKAHETTAFSVFIIFVVLWAITEFFQRLSVTPETAMFWNAFAPMGWVVVPVAFFVFAILYTRNDTVLRSGWSLFILTVPTALFLYLAITSEAIVINDPTQAQLTDWGFIAPVGPYFGAILLWLESLFVASLILLIKKYRESSGAKQKRQVLLIIIAILIPLLGGTITDGLLPIYEFQILPTAVLLTTVMTIMVAYAILRYSLFLFNPATVSVNILGAMQEIVLILDNTYTIEYANKRALELLHYSQDRLIGMPLSALFENAAQFNAFQEHIILPLEHQSIAHLKSTALVGESKQLFPVAISASKIAEQTEGNPGYCVVATDIARVQSVEEQNRELELARSTMQKALTKERALEDELALERDRMKAVISSMSEGMVVVNKHLKVTFINPVAQKLLAGTEVSVTGHPIEKLVTFYHGEQALTAPLHPLAQTLERHEVIVTDLQDDLYFQTKTKKRFPVIISTAPLEREAGSGAVMVFRDITDEKRIDEAKSEFVSLASHQLRTPLATIKWYAQMLQLKHTQNLNAKQKDYLNEIMQANHRMIGLVNSLLNVSRVELGTFAINPETFKIVPLVKSILSEQERSIAKKHLNVNGKYHPGLPTIQSDPNLIRIILQNLLSNAIKYTPDKGTISLEILDIKEKHKLARNTVTRNTILIKISDTGYGIPAEQQPKLYAKLFRADNVKELDTEGTGLGLYLVKSILDHIGGSIWFESTENKGTTFYVAIPLTGISKQEGIALVAQKIGEM